MTGDRSDGGSWAGALLVGGRSRRMGRPKVSLPLPNGETLGEAAIRSLEAVASDIVLLGAADLLPERLARLPVIPDNEPGLGPAAGIEALLASGRAGRYVVLPCDMPLFPADELRRLLDIGRDRPAVFRVDGSSRIEPFPLVIHAGAHAAVLEAIGGGTRDVIGILARLDPAVVRVGAEKKFYFLNVNEPADLESPEILLRFGD